MDPAVEPAEAIAAVAGTEMDWASVRAELEAIAAALR